VPLAPAAAVTSNAPVAAQETLTYPSRLEGQEPVVEKLKAAPAKSADDVNRPVAKAEPSKQLTPPSVPKPSSSATLAGEPSGNGFVVQVAAVNDRREAETIATRLAGKGYPSFVTTPPRGAARMFRVRIGKYPSRREAEAVAARLQKEDQFKPWITR